MREVLVDIKALSLEMVTLDGVARVLNGVNLTILKEEVIKLVKQINIHILK